jgi:hypothetical protein
MLARPVNMHTRAIYRFFRPFGDLSLSARGATLVSQGSPGRLRPESAPFHQTCGRAQNVPLEGVQHLAGHADARTTRLYDRRPKRMTRNLVEKISI